MSVGLYLLARSQTSIADPDEFLSRAQEWMERICTDLRPYSYTAVRETAPTLCVGLHPAAEEVELSLIDSQHLTACANCSSAGPGYHIFVCDLLKRFADEFGFEWLDASGEEESEYQDEAEYFFTRKEENVYTHMHSWLGSLCGYFAESDERPTDLQLCMSMGERFASTAGVITPLGPRSAEWMKATSEDGRNGADFFAWYKPGLNAEYFLGRALVRMWSAVRWRKPINDSERDMLRYVADSLATAYKLDTALKYPWSEWSEILFLLGERDPELDFVHRQAHTSGKSSIGYRRNDVFVDFAGHWTIRIPGSFSAIEADEDKAQFMLDPPREVWFTAYTYTEPDSPEEFAKRRDDLLKRASELVEIRDDYFSTAEIKKRRDGLLKSHFILQASSHAIGARSVLTIVYPTRDQEDWAINTWRSLQPPKRPSSPA